MLTRSRYFFAVVAMLVVVGGLFATGAVMPQTVSADHYDDYCDDPYYDDDDDCYDDCDDYYDPYYNDDDCYYDCDDYDPYYGYDDDCYDDDFYPGFLSIVASPGTIMCGATTVITVDIHQPHSYASGVTVALGFSLTEGSTSFGTVKPATLQQSVNGRAVFTYTAPPEYKGPVYVAASTEYEENNLTLQVNCNIAPPKAPQISAPVVSAGGIQPPNTGDGGMVASDSGAGWQMWFVLAGAMTGSVLYVANRLVRR